MGREDDVDDKEERKAAKKLAKEKKKRKQQEEEAEAEVEVEPEPAVDTAVSKKAARCRQKRVWARGG